MKWYFSDDLPIYIQLIEQIQQRILCAFYPPGSKIPSVRDLAEEAAVNPNTMQKALQELETTGLLYSQRTVGKFITTDTNLIRKMKKEVAMQKTKYFFSQLKKINLSNQEIMDLLTRVIEEE